MAKKLQLTIPAPCHENWDEMTPADKGKFCGSCQKQVVDFSNMNDRQVAEFFKKPSTGSVCGRFMTDQLDRDIEIPKKRIPWVKYFFQFALPAFLVSIKASAQKSQGKIRVSTVRNMGTMVVKKEAPFLMGDVDITACRKPLIGDTVVMPEVVVTAVANPQVNGTENNIAQILQGKISGPVVTVTDKPIDIGTKRDLSINAIDQASSLQGESGVIVLGGAYSIKSIRKARQKNIRLLVKELKDTIARTISIKSFNVFPNPVPSGSNLTIGWKQAEEGYYTLKLLNQSGQSVHQQEIWIDAGARLLNIAVPPLAAGSYFLVLANKKSGKKFTEKIIVQ